MCFSRALLSSNPKTRKGALAEAVIAAVLKHRASEQYAATQTKFLGQRMRKARVEEIVDGFRNAIAAELRYQISVEASLKVEGESDASFNRLQGEGQKLRALYDNLLSVKARWICQRHESSIQIGEGKAMSRETRLTPQAIDSLVVSYANQICCLSDEDPALCAEDLDPEVLGLHDEPDPEDVLVPGEQRLASAA